MAEKLRYSDAELQEFKVLILEKLEQAQKEYDDLRSSMVNSNDTADTSPTFKVLEEGANTLNRESLAQLANRQLSFIQKLKAALIRIENKTYGVIATAAPRIVLGKISEISTQQIGPHENINDAE